ncbi:hypothetical protein C380_10770 [Acidovorax sp. KKS102]|nr:hypothetical protein C380_10770 [Acidovorax sp. KKS102]
MTDNTQPEALRLADALHAAVQTYPQASEDEPGGYCTEQDQLMDAAATELCVQHTRIAELEAQLESIGAGGVNGPLMGQPQAMPDLSALTERGAKAWAGVDAQGLRDGVASAGSGPVYQARYRNGFWQDSSRERFEYLQSPEITSAEDWETRILYIQPSPPEGMVGGWQDIATAPEGQMVVVGWLDHEDTEHPERHDFDLLEDGCWQQWHERAEHVEVIGGHGVSYTPPYTVWMPVSPIPTSPADSGKGE